MAKNNGLTFESHIRAESRKEARWLADEYMIYDSGGILYLRIYAAADTTERNAIDILKKEGMTFTDRFGQKKSHPLLTVIRDARAQKMMALKNLNLDILPNRDGPGRPPGE